MRQRIADYIADFLVGRGVADVFSVVGGGAMHLNDALGHHPGLHVTYNHHEQACAMGAEAYARFSGRIAAVCVTTGPGGLNTLTGVAGGWLDSVPMFILSGQVRYDTTARYGMRFTQGLPLRALGDQEYDIVKSVEPMTKYAAMLEDPADIRYMLEKAWYLAVTGRPGPVWLDIPVNFQGMEIETEGLRSYDPAEDDALLPPAVTEGDVAAVLEAVRTSERPVIYAGGGVRLSGGFEAFRTVADRLSVPVVTYWNSIDLIEDEHPLYVGRGGNMGDRAGNFAVQNADLVLAIGTRLSIRQVGYDFKSWARAAKVVMVDADRAELKKHTVHVDMPIWADARDFCEKLAAALPAGERLFRNETWLRACQGWKARYPVTLPRHREDGTDHVNVYAFLDELSGQLPAGSLTAVSNGACAVAGHQAWHIKKGTRFLNNNAIASMGYGLPAAIGLCIAGGRRDTVCLEGDGSIMMNLQELQTVITNRLPVKLFLINNQGYHSIRITQNNIFGGHTKVGIGEESGDLSFPRYEALAAAFGYPYYAVRSNKDLETVLPQALARPGFVFCEVFTDTQQVWEPKSSAKRLPDGTIVSPPLEDLAPFLPREELAEQMFIPLLPER